MYLVKLIIMKAQKGMLQTDSVAFSSPAGWLLDITKLKLGESIGEGEFGGELSLVYSPYLSLSLYPDQHLCTMKKNFVLSVRMYTHVFLHLSCL